MSINIRQENADGWSGGNRTVQVTQALKKGIHTIEIKGTLRQAIQLSFDFVCLREDKSIHVPWLCLDKSFDASLFFSL
ncbi:hypothetical protein [Marinobacter sp. BGYM27]|uniref:hypothetical protein n=1 Tax=Marinobacter sp. BGYM27 TaxID=2975597 RepID=UPI0021A73203|nr:hypothetical protein [Marinobacter sp. BGYM27]MDG5499750.1 hypothetical protein [Marinobacter sp. BGYM27]